ncbi:MAG TPA: hypothetical protein VGM88_18200 [Kofleriaceae bacterium]
MKRALLLLVCAACGNHPSDHEQPPPHPPEPPRHVPEPATDQLRPLPPHAIRADGVGPYKLGVPLADLSDQLPSGPRMAVYDIPGLVHRNVIRAEEDAILVEGEPNGAATFIAVVGGDVARTESGVHVGSTRDELVHALGAAPDDPDSARDPRLVVPGSLPNARAILDGERVIGLAIAAAPPRTAAPIDCPRPTPARVPEHGAAFGACLTAGGPGELVEVEGDELSIHAAEGERALTAMRIPGLAFAAALRNPADGRDDIVAVARADESTHVWTLAAFRLDAGKLVRSAEPALLYSVSSANARWIGSDLGALDLYLELTSKPDAIEVGGLLAVRAGDKLRDVVVLLPVSVPRRRGKAITETPAAPEAPHDLPDAPSPDGH